MKKILLGMSGGVDSAVSAILLKQQGYEVVGATMKLYNLPEGCGATSAINDAKKVCEQLQIEHHVLDFTKEFKEHVINNFINTYAQGKTPNPCVECNKFIKFDLMYKKAKELGIEYIATGHYAKTEYSEKYNCYVIRKSDSLKKDQSYVLYNIKKDIIKNIIFPLGNFTDKSEIRKIAAEHGLHIASKSDSQEICFIPDDNYGKFLLENLKEKPKPGNIVNTKGEILGKHNGLIYHTIGQRKGMGISHPTPLYVIKLDKEKNEVVVGETEETYRNNLIATDVNYTLFEPKEPLEVLAKIRYAGQPEKVTIYPMQNGEIEVEFEKPIRAVTPGQSVVFYLDDVLFGGGKIEFKLNCQKDKNNID